MEDDCLLVPGAGCDSHGVDREAGTNHDERARGARRSADRRDEGRGSGPCGASEGDT